jgi:hypothetical protein
MGHDTFLAYIDFQKAFDSVERNFLLYKLSKIGIVGHFYNAISSMYSNPKSRVMLNEFETDYFDCPIGVKQGDCLSPTLFAIFINDLAEEIKASNVGLDLDSTTFINILLYADDIVLLAKTENDLQFLLFLVETWCKNWRLEVNLTKTNIMHIRGKRKQQSKFMFLFDRRPVPYCTTYKYLGCSINEHLNYEHTVDLLADSAGRALSSIITKMIKNGGFPYNVFCTLYQACVCSIADYGGEVFGFDQYDSAQKIHLRAARSFLGVNKTTPIVGIISEFNLLLPQYRTQLKMVRQYHRVLKCSENNMSKKVFVWDKKLNDENQIQSWYSEVRTIFTENAMQDIFESGNLFILKQIIEKLHSSMLKRQQFLIKIQCLNTPKLRTFVKFKDFFSTPTYVTKPLSFIQRKFLAKIRLGCLELRIETGRYARPRLPAEARLCQVCDNNEQKVEDEYHFIFECQKYEHERFLWLNNLQIPTNFLIETSEKKLDFALNDPNNVKLTAQFIINIFDSRSKIVNNLPSTNNLLSTNNVTSTNNLFHLLPHDQCPACSYT